jgi:nucleotide-binding universal stress UspA family protein
MIIPRKILFATDFSTRDRCAFELACRLAEAWKDSLLILHIDVANEVRSSTALHPNQELYEIYPRNLEVEFEHLLRQGDPVDSILKIEHQRNVDMIVLGTHGRQGFERIFAGSVAEKIIRRADCPVLTVRESTTFSIHKMKSRQPKVLVPIDFSVHSYAALDFATSLAGSIGASLTILYVDETDTPAKARYTPERGENHRPANQNWLQLKKVKPKSRRVPFGHKLLHGTAADVITRFASKESYDFVVLGTHGRSGIGRVVMGSVAEKVVRAADCAVITVKPSNKRIPVLFGQR